MTRRALYIAAILALVAIAYAGVADLNHQYATEDRV
jgi:hypothetical protein